MSRYGLLRNKPLPAQAPPTEVSPIAYASVPATNPAPQTRVDEARASRRSFVRWSFVAVLAFVLNYRAELYQLVLAIGHFADSLFQACVEMILLAVFVAAFLRFFLIWFLVYLRLLLMTIATFVFIILALISGNTKPPTQTQTAVAVAPAVTHAETSETDWTERPAWSRTRSGSPR
jgi:cellulose synthase/poly-beta-1,6-N-acetylglucosamine synthase-like glycosyltransferase